MTHSVGLLWRTLFFMNLARVANSSVVCVSAADACAGLILAIMTVRALPPSESCTGETWEVLKDLPLFDLVVCRLNSYMRFGTSRLVAGIVENRALSTPPHITPHCQQTQAYTHLQQPCERALPERRRPLSFAYALNHPPQCGQRQVDATRLLQALAACATALLALTACEQAGTWWGRLVA